MFQFSNLVAVASLAVLGLSFGPEQVTALSHASGHGGEAAVHHRAIAANHASKRAKRANTSNSKRCKPRPTSTSSSAPAPTSTSSAAPSPSPSPSNTNNNNNNGNNTPAPKKSSPGTSSKLGLAWGGDPSALPNFKKNANMPLYNWAIQPPYNAAQLGYDYFPMIWGTKNVNSGCENNGGCAWDIKASDINYVAFVNEPNEPGQANLAPEDALSLWWSYMQPLANQGVKTIGPVTSSNPNGLTWVKNFYQMCTGCTVDIQAVHWYDTTAQKFIDYVTLWHNTFGKPIWVTEYACQNYNGGAQCSTSEIYSFQAQVTGWMDSQDFVQYYMPFGLISGGLPDGVNQENALISGSGSPTNLAYTIGY